MPGTSLNFPGLLGMALLFWGWRAGFPALALLMAVLLEARPWVQHRWSFSGKDFDRLVDLTSLVVTGISIYLISLSGAQSIFRILVWLPMALYLLVLVQRYSLAGQLTLSNLFWSLRRPSEANSELAKRPIDISLVYSGICLMAATAVQKPDPWLPLWWSILIIWPLFFLRSRRPPRVFWVTSLVLALGLAYLIQGGLKWMQGQVESAFIDWMKDDRWEQIDLATSTTAIGRLGKLKLSDTILFRVKNSTRPPLLRQASFQAYRKGNWYGLHGSFTPVGRMPELGGWQLTQAPVGSSRNKMVLRGATQRSKALLPLPAGATHLEDILAEKLTVNAQGAVRLEGAPGYIEYSVSYQEGVSVRDSPPEAYDLAIPREQQAIVKQIVGTLSSKPENPAAVVSSIKDYFSRGFRYSLIQRDIDDDLLPLNHFLSTSRRGHCEHYATATVLLLRAAGVPARYATGYAAVEYSDWEASWLIRARHAHAWAMVWLDGHWVDLDTTPAIWAEREAADTGWWRPAGDLLSWLTDRFQAWRWRPDERSEDSHQILLWLLLPVGFYVIWRFSRNRSNRISSKVKRDSLDSPDNKITPFQHVRAFLENEYPARLPGETLYAWIARILPDSRQSLVPLLRQHYKGRFSAHPLSEDESRQLHRDVNKWLKAHGRPVQGMSARTGCRAGPPDVGDRE